MKKFYALKEPKHTIRKFRVREVILFMIDDSKNTSTRYHYQITKFVWNDNVATLPPGNYTVKYTNTIHYDRGVWDNWKSMGYQRIL